MIGRVSEINGHLGRWTHKEPSEERELKPQEAHNCSTLAVGERSTKSTQEGTTIVASDGVGLVAKACNVRSSQ